MSEGAGSAMRGARVVATSAVAATLAAGAHAVGGGRLPSVLLLATLGSLVLLAVAVLSRWHLRMWTLVPVLAGLQAALHGTLTFLTPGATSAALDLSWPHGFAHGAVVDGAGAAAQVPFALVGSVPLAHDHVAAALPVMLLGHAAATLASALVLVGSDAAARRTLCWMQAVLLRIVCPIVPLVGAAARVAVAADLGFARVARRVVSSHPHRGPPQLISTA